MAIALFGAGTVATGTTSVAPAPVASVAAGHRSLLFVGTKPETATIATPTGWTLVADVIGGAVVATGADVGQTRLAVFVRDDAFSGAQTVTITGGNTSWGVIVTYSKAATHDWAPIASGSGNDVTGGTATYSAASITNPGWWYGDVIVAAACIPTDLHTAVASMGVNTASGTQLGTTTQRALIDSGTGNDIGGVVFDKIGTQGASTTAITVTATFTGATNAQGPALVVRLREKIIVPGTYVRAEASNNSGTLALSLAVEIPPEAQAGDLAYIAGNIGGGLTAVMGVTAASGNTWTNRVAATAHSASTNQIGIWERELTADDLGTTVSITSSLSRSIVATMLVLKPGYEFDFAQLGTEELSAAPTLPSVTPTADDSLLLGFVHLAGTVTAEPRSIAPPAGWTEWCENTTGTGAVALVSNIQTRDTLAAAGVPTSTADATTSGGANTTRNLQAVIVLKPPAGVPSASPNGRAAFTVDARGDVTKIATPSGRCSLAIAATGTARKIAPRTGSSAFALAATGTARKIAPRSGAVALALTAYGPTAEFADIRTPAGVCGLTLATRGAAVKVAPVSAVSSLTVEARSGYVDTGRPNIEAISSNFVSGAGATSIAVNVPVETVTGRVLVAVLAWRGQGAITPSEAGWSEHTDTSQSGGPSLAIYSRPVVDGDPTSYTWTFGAAASRVVGVIALLRNASGIDDVQSATGNSNTVTAPAATAAGMHRLALRIWESINVDVFSDVGYPLAQKWYISSGGAAAGIVSQAGATQDAETGTTGTSARTIGTARTWSAATVVIAPVPVGAPDVRSPAGVCGLSLVSYGAGRKVAPVAGSAALSVVARGAVTKITRPIGRASLAVAAVGTTRKIATRAGSCAFVLAAVGAARKRAPVAGSAPLALTAAGSILKRATPAGTAPLTLGAAGSTTKRAQTGGVVALTLTAYQTGVSARPVAGRVSLAISARGTTTKRATALGSAGVALSTVGTTTKRATPAARAALVLSDRSTARHLAPIGARVDAVLTPRATAVKVARPATVAALALTARGATLKIARPVGAAPLVYVPAGLVRHLATIGGRSAVAFSAYQTGTVPRFRAGRTSLALGTYGLATKRATPGALAAFSAVPRGIARRVALPTGTASLVVVARGATHKLARPVGAAFLVAYPRGIAAKRARPAGASGLVIVTRGVSIRLASPAGRAELLLTAWSIRTVRWVTWPPDRGTTAPAPGVTWPPALGQTAPDDDVTYPPNLGVTEPPRVFA